MVINEKIGIAIATFNSGAVIADCLSGFRNSGFRVVLFDDASSDDTVAIARTIIPGIEVISGRGDAWWAGGTSQAVEFCLKHGCDFVVLLNPDVQMTEPDVLALVGIAEASPSTIVAPLVVDHSAPDTIAWAGSHFARIPWTPIYTSTYVAKRGAAVSDVGTQPYEVDEAHGRGVVISKEVISRIGMFDVSAFPHYGADNDFSLRARRNGIRIKVVPNVRVSLATSNSGMHFSKEQTTAERYQVIRDYLMERKKGEALRVWWHLLSRHVPPYAVVPSYVFNVSLNVLRRALR
jgi:GT2 family glycosyltransferase